MQRVEEKNTKKFKDTINTIINYRGHEIGDLGRIHWNFNLRKEIKPIRHNNERLVDVIAYYYNKSESDPKFITYSDYIAILREIKIGTLIGEEVTLVARKTVNKPTQSFNQRLAIH